MKVVDLVEVVGLFHHRFFHWPQHLAMHLIPILPCLICTCALLEPQKLFSLFALLDTTFAIWPVSSPHFLPKQLDQISELLSTDLCIIGMCPAASVLRRLAVLDPVNLRMYLLHGAVEARTSKDLCLSVVAMQEKCG